MISNERRYPYGQVNGNRWQQPFQNPNSQPRVPVPEDSLKSGQVQIERKLFIFSLKANPRGRLLRITEQIGDRHNSIIIPATGLGEFKRLLEEIIQAAGELPPVDPPPADV